MPEALDLSAAGVRIYGGQFFHHDYLWFSSFEVSKVTRTAPIVHNYALSYATSRYEYAIYYGSRPSYDADLRAMPVYTTPARPGTSHRIGWTRLTQNAIDTRTQRTEGPRGINTPSIGWRIVLNPCWETGHEDQGFHFYAFVRNGYSLPTVIRLGKKGCPVRLRWAALAASRAMHVAGPVQPTHALNPLDVQGQILSYEPISIPPHLVFRQAEIADDWFVFEGKHCIHVPRRFTPAGPLPLSPGNTGQRRRRSRR
ncbi:MAG: type I-D CRISPR-associated protein Cas5/Csc1 [Acidobacteriaceae bacterium]|nr:type I-D CRISPR-associated protein Cas5/Csc1 [Acidobacteriaceae bacterium]MBV9779430.1 type I-D CRISPR-associated protein Cas5/Csc1 [Acidobacteriaceae bacterium]